MDEREAAARNEVGAGEDGDPSDPLVGHGQHTEAERTVYPMSVAPVRGCGRLVVCAGRNHPPVTGRSDHTGQIAQAGRTAGEPGAGPHELEEIHSHARAAAAAAEAAGLQSDFWTMHAYLFEHQKALEDADVEKYATELGLDRQRFDRDWRSPKVEERIDRDLVQWRAERSSGHTDLLRERHPTR